MNMFDFDLQRFASNTNITTDTGMSAELKTYYDDYLIDTATPRLVHDQFGQKRPIPQGGGRKIEFRKVSPLPKALTALTEGVTPDGQKLTISTVEASVEQYGGYVELSDMVVMSAIDDNLVIAAKQLGAQAGKTLDTITREVLVGGTNVQYAEGQVDSRGALVGGKESGNHYLTVDAVRRAVRTLKRNDAEPIDGTTPEYKGAIRYALDFSGHRSSNLCSPRILPLCIVHGCAPSGRQGSPPPLVPADQ